MIKFRFDPMKNSKLPYYLKNAASLIVPAVLCRISLRNILKTVENYDPLYINERVNYYNKLSHPFTLDVHSKTIKEFKSETKKTYFFDLYRYLRYFSESF